MVDTIIWIAQGFLALFFLAAGAPKVLGQGLERWTGFDVLPRPLVVVIGVSEVVAAFALVLPMLAHRVQWTTPLAALGLVVVSLMASGFHIRAGEGLPAVETVLWAALATCITVGRWDQLSTGPSLADDLFVPAVLILMAVAITVLVVLFRRPVAVPAESRVSPPAPATH